MFGYLFQFFFLSVSTDLWPSSFHDFGNLDFNSIFYVLHRIYGDTSVFISPKIVFFTIVPSEKIRLIL